MNVYRGLRPYLTIPAGCASDAVAFYKRAFAASEKNTFPAEDGKRLMHCHLEINGSALMFADDFPESGNGEPVSKPSGMTVHLDVDDADKWWKRAVDAGTTIKIPIDDQFWGARYGQLVDPFGFTWGINGPLAKPAK